MGKKISNSLLTLSSAAILAVYAAGYERTGPAADRFARQAEHRRAAAAPVSASVAGPAVLDEVSAAPSPSPKKGLRTVRETAPPTAVVAGAEPVVSFEPKEEWVPAAAPVPEPAPAPVVPDRVYKDGTYLGWGYSRHGDIQAFVRIQDGRIVAAGIEKCWTRYSCSWIEHLPPQVVLRQSPDVDYVSGATQSVDAFYGGIVEALSKAK